MNAAVHHRMTREWARDAGFDERSSEIIGAACLKLDEARISKPWCHFALLGAFPVGWLFFRAALASNNLVLLGFSLHCLQDGVGHGWIPPWRHVPELDDWRRLDPVRQAHLELKTRRCLASYAKRTAQGV